MTHRDMTVGELISALQEMPDYYPVLPIINGTVGIITGVRRYEFEHGASVLIGECDLPFDLVESMRTPPMPTEAVDRG